MKRKFPILFVLLFVLAFCAEGFGAEASAKQTICLNMIVKNESKVITRCLESILPMIDTWVIVDTGSTDGTQDIIQDYMASKGVPGQLYERPWKNFGHNRSEALELARGTSDYVLIIDADEILDYDPGFTVPELTMDFYYIMTHYSGMTYARVQLINQSHLNWSWVGVLHETVYCPEAHSVTTLEGVRNVVFTDGARSTDPLKFVKDAQVLEEALKEEPDNSRYVFYLAQSYRDAGMFEESLVNYQRRVKMGGWDQEIFWSMLQVACLQDWMNMPYETYSTSYLKAYSYRPTRVEPLYHLMFALRHEEEYQEGYEIGEVAIEVPLSKDILFLDNWIYDYGILLEYSICAYWIGKYEECQKISLQILAKPKIPNNVRECVENNLGFANAKILEARMAKRQAEKMAKKEQANKDSKTDKKNKSKKP